MAENQKNPRDLDENLNQRKDQGTERTQDQSRTQQNQQQRTGSGSSAANEKKSPVSEEEETFDETESESPESGVNPQQRTDKSPGGQQSQRKSDSERRNDSV